MEEETIKISQFEAATNQLNIAIKLFFEGIDYLSVCTLAGAADRIFEDIYKHERHKHLQKQLLRNKDDPNYRLRFSMYEEFKILIKEEHHKEFFKDYYRKNQNFLKHADLNYGEELNIDFDTIEMELSKAVMNYNIVCEQHTLPIISFMIWFFMRHPSLMANADKNDKFADAIKYLSDFYKKHGQKTTQLHCYDMLKLSCPHLFNQSDLQNFETISDGAAEILKSVVAA